MRRVNRNKRDLPQKLAEITQQLATQFLQEYPLSNVKVSDPTPENFIILTGERIAQNGVTELLTKKLVWIAPNSSVKIQPPSGVRTTRRKAEILLNLGEYRRNHDDSRKGEVDESGPHPRWIDLSPEQIAELYQIMGEWGASYVELFQEKKYPNDRNSGIWIVSVQSYVLPSGHSIRRNWFEIIRQPRMTYCSFKGCAPVNFPRSFFGENPERWAEEAFGENERGEACIRFTVGQAVAVFFGHGRTEIRLLSEQEQKQIQWGPVQAPWELPNLLFGWGTPINLDEILK